MVNAAVAGGIIASYMTEAAEPVGVGAILLVACVSILGGLWLHSASLEHDYLNPALGEAVSPKSDQLAKATTFLIVLWTVFMIVAWVSSKIPYALPAYCIGYAIYTFVATLWIQPLIKREITRAVNGAHREGLISAEKGTLIAEYYRGWHWKFVGCESIILAFAAVACSIFWVLEESSLIDHWWRSPLLFLYMELALSQITIFYQRWVRFYPRLNEMEDPA